MQTTRIDAANAGRRLDVFLRQLLPSVPLGAIMKWIRKGAVRINGAKAKSSTRIAAGDELSFPDAGLAAPSAPSPLSQPPRRDRALPALDILFEDEHLLVVNKPAGLACHSGTGHEHDSVLHRVEQYLGTKGAAPGHRPGLAHRLDRDVSGAIAVGKDAPTLRWLASGVVAGTIYKLYLALVDGRVSADSGAIDLPLRITQGGRRDQPKVVVDAQGLPAHTEYRVLQRFRHATLVEVHLGTGRMHQIRAHLLASGHPILGDPRYGPSHTRAKRCDVRLMRPFLHAGTLVLTADEGPRRIEAPLPRELDDVLKRLPA